MNTKSPFSLGAVVILSIVAIAEVALSIDTTLNAYAQNTTATKIKCNKSNSQSSTNKGLPKPSHPSSRQRK